jgi:DNA-binding CsgD family transcriptional regulator
MTDPVEERWLRQKGVDAFAYGQKPGVPRPPFRFPNCEMVWITATMDPDGVRKALPPHLTPSPTHSGAHLLWVNRSESAFGTVGGYLVAVEVDGLYGPDGFPAHFIVDGYYVEPFLPVCRSVFLNVAKPTTVRSEISGDRHRASAESGAGKIASFDIERDVPTPVPNGGLIYLSDDVTGQTVTFEVLWDVEPSGGRRSFGKVVDFALGPAASPLVRSLAPVEVIYAMSFTGMDFSWGLPRPIAAQRDEPSANLDLLGMMGRAAAIVSPALDLLDINEAARAILGTATLAQLSGQERQALEVAMAAAIGHVPTRVSDPLSLTLPQSRHSIIGRLLPMAPVPGSPAKTLLLLSDPERPVPLECAAALQLLGLTPAEARLAVVVADGNTARDAAVILGITENTARSSLKLVYDKLGIGRQTELAKLVANLAMP